ncbi:VWA domain-containing protein [soil metagenome]
MRVRYSAWTGTREPFGAGVSARDIIDELGDDLLAGDDLGAALARLARSGLAGRSGLDELRRRVAEARERELERMGLDGPAQQLAEALAPILERERSAVADAADDPIAQARGDELDALPEDPFAQLAALRDGSWFDAEAGAAFARLLEQFRRDVAEATFGELAAGLAAMGPDDVERMRQLLDELADLAERHERGEDVADDYDAFAQRYERELSALGDDGQPPARLEDLLAALARRMAAMSSLLAGMQPDQRHQLAQLAAQALGDVDLGPQADRLRATLRRQFPQQRWSQPPAGVPQAMPDASSLAGAVDWMDRVAQIDELGKALGQRYPGARLEDIDVAAVEDLLDPQAAEDVRALREMERALEEAGAARHSHGRLELTPRGVRRLGEASLARIYQPARLGPMGEHAATRTGGDSELAGTTRPLQFGDPFRLDVTRTIGNALRRRADGAMSGRSVGLTADDFELAEAERRVRVVTALLLDMSFSMPLRGNWGPAKRVALALEALIASRFPGDELVMIGFSDLARRLQPRDLLVAGWERVYGTNMEHAFALARREFARHPAAQRQVIMITDGEPTAHLENAQPVFAWPPSPTTLAATLREGRRLRRCGATLNVFLLDHDPGAGRFVETLVRHVGGRLLYPDLQDLGSIVVRDFLSRRGT